MRLIYLAIATHSKYYDFMYELLKAQSIVYPDMKYYYVYRVPNPQDYLKVDSIIFENMIINEWRIYTCGHDNIFNACVLKTIDAMRYLKNTHAYDYIVRTNCGTYFNHENMKIELRKITNVEPILYGIHTGNMAYGALIAYNKSAVDVLIEKAINTKEFALNRVDDLAFTNISRELGFTCLNRSSHLIYDSIHEFTGIAHLGLYKEFDSKWLIYKQKTCVDEWRNTSDIYRYLQFVRRYDIHVYNLIHITNDNNDNYYVGTPEELANCTYRETEFLYNFGKMEYFDYNIGKCMESLKFYNQTQLRNIILWILRVYRPPTSREVEYLRSIVPYFTDIKSIHAELFYYTYHDLWMSANPLQIFSK